MTPLDHVVAIGLVLDSLDVPRVLGGSMASSMVGEPRSTMDIDVAAALGLGNLDRLVAAVKDEYYVSAEMARDAVLRHSSFDLIHLATGMKVDLFPLSNDHWMFVSSPAGSRSTLLLAFRCGWGPRRTRC